MPQPSVILLDGASLPYPGVEVALRSGGWEVKAVPSAEALGLKEGDAPSLILVDPRRSGPAGLAAVEALRGRYPGLPVVTLGNGAVPGVVGSLDPAAPPQSWAGQLNGILGTVRAERNKFTAEDLFADILADLDSPSDLPASEPVQADPVVPLPPPRPPQMPEPPRPHLSQDALRTAPLPPKGLAPAPAGNPAAKVPPPTAEFTLSGISGIKDPFSPAEVPAALPEPLPKPVSFDEGGFDLEFVGDSENTPIARRPDPLGPPPVSRPVVPPPAPPPPAPEAAEPPPGSLEEFGNYYLLEKIAVGGMAELFKARQRGVHNFEKIVAIKRILPHLSDNDEFVRMFIDEAKLAAQLTHPNIVQIFDLGKAGGFYYIAMEFVDGRDLRSLLRKVREYRMPFPEPVAAFVAMKVAGALDYAHRKKGMNDKELKLVHRDISPQNILIGSEGAVKLVDFGIAKAATKSTQTMAGALKGKLLYMSPEQALGQPLDSRSDIYSLGLVLFELLTGERCFQADSELGVLEKVRLGKVQDVRSVNPTVSAEVAGILERALQKDVERRYPSARLLERDLKGYLSRLTNDPSEHEVAEYVNTLLRGTQEQLEELVASHWPVPVQPVRSPEDSAASATPPQLPQAPVLEVKNASARPPLELLPPEPTLEGSRRPGWVMPLVVILVIIGVIVLGRLLTQ